MPAVVPRTRNTVVQYPGINNDVAGDLVPGPSLLKRRLGMGPSADASYKVLPAGPQFGEEKRSYKKFVGNNELLIGSRRLQLEETVQNS